MPLKSALNLTKQETAIGGILSLYHFPYTKRKEQTDIDVKQRAVDAETSAKSAMVWPAVGGA